MSYNGFAIDRYLDAAAVMAVGMGIIPSLEHVQSFIRVTDTYEPNQENHQIYDRYYKVFRNSLDTNDRVQKAKK